MGTRDLSGTTDIGGEGIKKHFRNIEPWEPIFEYVWNGLDAGARHVDVVVQETDMGGIDRVVVADDGHGIDPNTLKDTFGRFFESSKNEDVDQHGSHGRGRLAFHTICNRAVWFTKGPAGGARIVVEAQDIKRYGATDLDAQDQHRQLSGSSAGTVVELDQFTGSLPTIPELREKFSVEFGWFLALHPGTTVTLDAVPVTVPSHEVLEQEVHVGDASFKAQIIRWDDKPSSEKSHTPICWTARARRSTRP